MHLLRSGHLHLKWRHRVFLEFDMATWSLNDMIRQGFINYIVTCDIPISLEKLTGDIYALFSDRDVRHYQFLNSLFNM